jgi:DNA-binding transcriptional regulator YhcF (GntR family)
MPLLFRIQPSLPDPAYRQIVGAVTRALRDGQVREGERLPSIRMLARELAINPNTVARAYRELEHKGLIVSIQGSGFEARGGYASSQIARQAFAAAVGEAIERIGPKETLRIAREAVSAAKKKAEEGCHA